MLTFEDIQQLNDFFKLAIDLNQIQTVQGGDVNETFIAVSNTKKYIIKKIHLQEYTKDYKVTTDEIINSIEFSEHIAQQLVYTTQVSSALLKKQGCVLKTKSGLLIVYPFISGAVKENDAISLEMIKRIALFLSLIHHTVFSFDKDFAVKKLTIFKNIGQEIINLSLWSKIKKYTHNAYFFPKLNRIADYLLINKQVFSSAITLLEGNTICHNDLKPKNVLWEDEQHFGVIDWETTGLFDSRVDYLDTLLAWCTHYNGNKIVLKTEKLQAFLTTYPMVPAELKECLPIVLIKWYFWLGFCIKKIMLNHKQWKHYFWHIRYSINFIIFLIDNDIFKQLESVNVMKNAHE